MVNMFPKMLYMKCLLLNIVISPYTVYFLFTYEMGVGGVEPPQNTLFITKFFTILTHAHLLILFVVYN